MRQILLCFLLIFGLGLFFKPVYAQHDLKGKVLDQIDSVGLVGARLSLYNVRDSLVRQISTGEEGEFTFSQLQRGNYRLLVSFLGYKVVNRLVNIDRQAQKLLIPLQADFTLLDSVEIVVKPQPVIIKGDTTVFDAGAFSTEPYADADALVSQIPGVEIDADGKVKAQGEDVQRIIVDGKEFFSSDPAVALKTLPADVIDKIELIDDKSEQSKLTGFDDGNRRKVINIVTKPDKRQGYFGRMAGAGGSEERYNTGGFVNMFSGDRRISANMVSNNINQGNFSSSELIGAGGRGRGGGGGGGIATQHRIAVNYNNTWWEDVQFNVNYSFENSENELQRTSNREVLIGEDANQFNVSAQQTNRKNRGHVANIRLEYKKDSTQRLTFSPNIHFNSAVTDNTNTTSTLGNAQELINHSSRQNNGENSAFTIGGTLDYGLRLNDKGRSITLHLQGNSNSNNNEAYAFSNNVFYEDDSVNRTDTVNNLNDSRSNSQSWNGRLTYTEPLGAHSRMMANVNGRTNNSYSDRKMYDFLEETGQYELLNQELSNEFRNDFRFYGTGLNYQFSKESFLVDVGLDYQQADMINNRIFPEIIRSHHRFTNYLPNANFTYRFSQDRRLRLNYNTGTNPPNVLQLQDVINNQNPLNITGGNPDLKQEFRHQVNLHYNSVNRVSGANFSASITGALTQNRIVNSTFIATADTLVADNVLLGKGAQFTRPENVNGYYNLRGNISFGIPLDALKVTLNLGTDLHHSRDVGLLNNVLTYTYNQGINQRIGINSKISRKIIFSVTYNGNYSMVNNSNNQRLNNNYYNQTIRNDVTYIFWKGIRIASSLNYRYNTGMAEGFDQRFFLWNASIGKKLFKREEAEITLSAFDLLNSNVQVSRQVTERYIEDEQSNILRQYFLLSFTYNLRKFGR
ncbi:TonB-dependent receptor [Olivibacter sp. SDN3]|uniref:TonB-dependent receptor n=1 Tax=Olivibacter sp. SDN3 TaxID=2764720 RepID=UPI001650E496|nr:TonB-dependent receptor [Olivibacter sp. SDN3]QNL50625.1 TonB-dependent receptor [Olivibacter sp. SDN3]